MTRADSVRKRLFADGGGGAGCQDRLVARGSWRSGPGNGSAPAADRRADLSPTRPHTSRTVAKASSERFLPKTPRIASRAFSSPGELQQVIGFRNSSLFSSSKAASHAVRAPVVSSTHAVVLTERRRPYRAAPPQMQAAGGNARRAYRSRSARGLTC